MHTGWKSRGGGGTWSFCQNPKGGGGGKALRKNCPGRAPPPPRPSPTLPRPPPPPPPCFRPIFTLSLPPSHPRTPVCIFESRLGGLDSRDQSRSRCPFLNCRTFSTVKTDFKKMSRLRLWIEMSFFELSGLFWQSGCHFWTVETFLTFKMSFFELPIFLWK
jgi:hypothetical protein